MNDRPTGGGRDEFPESPCNRICVLNDAGTCTGCKRSLEEISRWSLMSAEEQWEVVRQLAGRTL